MTDVIKLPDGYRIIDLPKLGVIYTDLNLEIKNNVIVSKNEKEDKKICSAITITAKYYDDEKNAEFTELSFLNANKKFKVEHKTFKTSEIGTNKMIETLTKYGVRIFNTKSFSYYLTSSLSAIDVIEQHNLELKNNCIVVPHARSTEKYGFQKIGMEYDLTRFITKKEILDTDTSFNIDAPLFETKGTLEGWKKAIEEVANVFNPLFYFKVSLALACASIVLPFLGSYIENPIFCLASPSGSGKAFLAAFISGIWGYPGTNGEGLLRTSKDSASNWATICSRLNNIPVVTTEVQDILNDKSKGVSYMGDRLYAFTQGSNGGRDQQDGTARDNVKIWRNLWAFMCEYNLFSNLTGGAASRLVVIESGLKINEHFMGDNTEDYYGHTISNYGIVGPLFVEKIIEYSKTHNIDNEFKALKKQVLKYMKNTKKASSIAILLYTYNLMCDFDLFPASFSKMTVEELLEHILDTNNVCTDPFEKVFEKWTKAVPHDVGIPFKADFISDEEYVKRAKTAIEVRGRKEYSGEYMKVYIPEEKLRDQMVEIAKKYEINGFDFSVKELAARGKLEAYKPSEKAKPRWKQIQYNIRSKQAEYVLVVKFPHEQSNINREGE